MNPLFVVGIWLSLGALMSLLAGSGIGRSKRRNTTTEHIDSPESPESSPRSAAAAAQYQSLCAVEWSVAAHRAATELLLGTRPGTIRRTAAPRPE